MKINKTLSTLALISVITLSGCNEETNPTDNSDIQVNATTLSSEEAKLVEEYIKPQGRFKHLFKPENKHLIEKLQGHVDSEWEKLLKLCGEK